MVSIRASPNLDIVGVKFDSKLTFEGHVRGIVSRVSQRIGILRSVKHICEHLCVTSLHLFSQSLNIVLRCGGQLLNVTFSFLSARCIRRPGFVPIRVSCCVINVVWLGLVCCTRLIWTLITFCSASFHLLLLEFDMPELRPQLIHWSLMYEGVERPNLRGLSCRIRLDCGITSTLCLIPECWMDSRVQSTVGCFSKLCLWVCWWAGACGVAKAIYKQLCFSNLGLCCWF